jgi:hypothetical protein
MSFLGSSPYSGMNNSYMGNSYGGFGGGMGGMNSMYGGGMGGMMNGMNQDHS